MMGSLRFHLPRLFLFAGLFLTVGFGASAAQAGPVYMFLVVDPTTTAGAGVSNSDEFSVTSNRSGAGSWHLYAVDDLADSYGIRCFFVKLNGDITSMSSRSPVAEYDGGASFGNDVQPAGFNLIRATTPMISASQSPYNNTQIGGLGISASNFRSATPGQSFSVSSSGQWGNYADPFTNGSLGNTGHTRNALFLAEGTYSGAAPTVDVTTSLANGGSGVAYWTDAGLTRSETALQLSSSNPFACPDCVNGHDPFLVTSKSAADPEPQPTIAVSPIVPTPRTTTTPPTAPAPPVDEPPAPPTRNEVPQETQPPIPSLDPPVINIGPWTEFVEVGVNDGLIYYIDPTDPSDPGSITIRRPELLVPRWRILQAAMVTNLAENIPQQLFGAAGEDLVDYEGRESMPMVNMWGVDHDGISIASFGIVQATGSSVFDSQVMHDAASAPEPAGIFLMMVAQGCFLLVARCRRR